MLRIGPVSAMRDKILISFDNTIGILGCDVDDALALRYLLGSDGEVDIVAVCTCFGNSTIEAVHDETIRLWHQWNLGIPLFKGAAIASARNPSAALDDLDVRDTAGEIAGFSAAAQAMVHYAATDPGELTILALGSLTDLYQASLIDSGFLGNLAGIVCMGGVTEPLTVGGRHMDELNFACDPVATQTVLAAACPVHVLTAQNCLPAHIHIDDLIAMLPTVDTFTQRCCREWAQVQSDETGVASFCCWDLVAAVYLVHPQLFKVSHVAVLGSLDNLDTGLLEEVSLTSPEVEVSSPEGDDVNFPAILDIFAFWADVARAYSK